MKTIAFDVDDVLNNLKISWINAYNVKYNDNKTLDDFKGWNLENYVKPECGEKIYEIIKTPNFFYNLVRKEYSRDVLLELSKHYEIIIVTDVSYAIENVQDKIKWLQENYPFISSDQYYLCSDKSRIKADYLVDDGVHNLVKFEGKRIKFKTICNENIEIDNCITVNDFKEIREYFLKELEIGGAE